MAQKEPLLVTLSEEDEQLLRALWQELQRPRHRGTPVFVGPRLTFNTWLVRCGVERARQIAEALAKVAAAPMSGTLAMEMPTMKTPPVPPEPAKATPPTPRRGPKPGSGQKENLTLSLDKTLVAWLKAQPKGASLTANEILLRSYRSRSK